MTRDIEAARKKAGATGGEQVVWIPLPEWSLAPAVSARLKHGVHWLDGLCYAKGASTGLAICLVASPHATPEEYAVAGKRLLAARLAEVDRALTLTREAVAARELKERIEEIEDRLEAGGPDSVTLEELREVTLYCRGPERLAELQQQARARTQTLTPSPEPGDAAGDTKEN